jgi:PD-(D/E)XK nuclease superfamily protein
MSTLDLSQYTRRTVRTASVDLWNLDFLDHWSPSSLAMLQRCPRAWQQRYVHGRKERPAEAPVIGSAVHTAIEQNFRQKIESHEDLPPIDLLDSYQEEIFPRTILEEQERAGVEILWDTSPDKARSRGRVMLSEYHGEVAPRIQPEAVELRVETNLGLPVPVVGRFDVRRSNSVIDVKTGKQATSKPKESWRIQAAVYGHAENKPVEFHSLAATPKTGKVTITTPRESEEMLVHPTLAERLEIIRSIKALSDLACFFMAKYGPDVDWPTLGTLHSWACGYCGYIKDCPAWQGRL